ncbi:hypothetical protein AMK33_37335 [Streptomyces sp. CB02400]|nr:hypothetical protein AMK33_37335 [Streptomyces sp. CB02400]
MNEITIETTRSPACVTAPTHRADRPHFELKDERPSKLHYFGSDPRMVIYQFSDSQARTEPMFVPDTSVHQTWFPARFGWYPTSRQKEVSSQDFCVPASKERSDSSSLTYTWVFGTRVRHRTSPAYTMLPST